MMTSIETIRADFPILQRTVKDHPLAYLDNAASSQKPLAVLQAMDDYYRHTNANVHRGVHTLSEEATRLYEGVRPHRPLHQRRQQQGNYLHPQRDRGHQPGGV